MIIKADNITVTMIGTSIGLLISAKQSKIQVNFIVLKSMLENTFELERNCLGYCLSVSSPTSIASKSCGGISSDFDQVQSALTKRK
jgi:hypothetical protein